MKHDSRRPRSMSGLQPPSARGKRKDDKSKKKAKSGADGTEVHAKEVREVIRGKDIVDTPSHREQAPASFDNKDLMFVRSWMMSRPLEPRANAAALVHFPRMWATRRGRYCRFQAPGAGVYGLLRARPTF